MTSLSDMYLVTQVAVFGNKRAFDSLVRKYQSPVRRFLLHLTLGNEMLSDDLAQDTFLKAYTSIGQFKGLSSFQTWLFRIAYHSYLDDRRKHADDVSTEDGIVMDDGARVEDTTLKMDVYSALSTLKEEERTCVTLQLIDGQPIEHIAKVTGLPPNTVKSHLRRGKERLTDYLKKNGYDTKR